MTGKANYVEFGQDYSEKFEIIDLVNNPELLETNADLAIISGLWFFDKNVMSKVDINSETKVSEVAKYINRNSKTYKDRETRYLELETKINC